MTDLNQIRGILDLLMRPVVEYNAPKKEYWGVTFQDNSIIAASPFFYLEISNLCGVQLDDGFYSYLSNMFDKDKFYYPLTVDQMRERLAGISSQYRGSARFPVSNLINRAEKLASSVPIKKCRTVFSVGYREEKDMILNFKNVNGTWMFANEKLPYVIVRDEKSEVPEKMMEEIAIYRCQIVNRTADKLYVNVIEPAGKMRAGILYSQKGFIPDNIEQVNRMKDIIPPTMIVGTNNADDSVFEVPPVHLDTTILNDLLRVFYLSSDVINISFANDPNVPVYVESIPNNPEKDLHIAMSLATLNPFYGAQRR